MGISVSLQGNIKMFSEHWDFWLLNMDSIVEILRIVSRRSRKLHLNSRGKELILETPNRNFLYGINLIIGICQKKKTSRIWEFLKNITMENVEILRTMKASTDVIFVFI